MFGRWSLRTVLVVGLLTPASQLAAQTAPATEDSPNPAAPRSGPQPRNDSGTVGVVNPPTDEAKFQDEAVMPEDSGVPKSLDEAIKRAMEGNADLQLADANRRQAEAAYNLARLKVTHEVIVAYKQCLMDRDLLKHAKSAFDAGKSTADAMLQSERASVKSFAELQYLLGEYSPRTGKAWHSDPDALLGEGTDGKPAEFNMFRRGEVQKQGHVETKVEQRDGRTVLHHFHRNSRGELIADYIEPIPQDGAAAPASKKSNAIDAKLGHSPAELSVVDHPLADLVDLLMEKVGVPFILDKKSFADGGLDVNAPITLSLQGESLTWHDVLTAISDTHSVRFVVRDYGVLVTTPDRADAIETGGGVRGGGFF